MVINYTQFTLLSSKESNNKKMESFHLYFSWSLGLQGELFLSR